MKKPLSRMALLATFAASALVACTTPAPPSAAVLAPNANLVVQGIPPIPASLAEKVAPYTEFRGHGLVAWHPTQRELLVSHRPAGGNTAQLFRVASPLAQPEALTAFADPVSSATYEPTGGRYLVFERSAGGSEADQLYRLDLPGQQATLLSEPTERHNLMGWLHKSPLLLVSSLPLDKTAQGGTRAQVTTTLRLLDPLQPASQRKLAELPGGGWYAGGIASDDRRVSLTRYVSATESEVWLMDLDGPQAGQPVQLLPAPGSNAKASYRAGEFMPGDVGVFITSDHLGEFNELMAYRFASREFSRITGHLPWDVDGVALSDNGAWLAANVNVEGRRELHVFDARTLKERTLPALPAGSVSGMAFHPKTAELSFSVASAKGPGQIHTLNLASQAVAAWTQPYVPPALASATFSEHQIVRWRSFDGLPISGLLNLPPARYTGKRPVLIAIHGGPEGQATVGFLNRNNYYINELGFAILQPNVRGSSGFGKRFLSLDDGFKREDSVKDIGALLDWIATQPQLDASRVIVTGGSYGGYMSLAVSTHYADRIRASIDVVGISNFVTFLQNTESYRRDLRRVEYGDEREPAMRAHLQAISPLTNASKITKPLFVVQGKNDPRVPYTEAEQIVAQARANQTPVWYLRAENEGHGFARKENADFQFYATIQFMQQALDASLR
ncbi:MAG: S9 family peptidase [Burkholderiales bacterium]|nr:S9 family peptidase [Burkholderiales bacterium]